MTKILVVDDEKELAQYLADQLAESGYEAETALDGVEAVLKAIDGNLDAIIMDIRMPKLDGINAIKIIRKITPDLPVLAFTGQAGQSDIVESVRQGAYTCLLKPIKFSELLKTLELMGANR